MQVDYKGGQALAGILYKGMLAQTETDVYQAEQPLFPPHTCGRTRVPLLHLAPTVGAHPPAMSAVFYRLLRRQSRKKVRQ